MELHEKLADHFAAKSLAHGRKMARCPSGAIFASQAHL